MKVSQTKKAFVPVTITLETEEEVAMMKNSLRREKSQTLYSLAEEDNFSAYDVYDFEDDVLTDLNHLNN